MENQIENLYEELKRIEDILVKADEKCPIATKDIGVNLQNREKSIKTAKYGPLNPEEENKEFWKEKMDRWDVSEDEAKKSLCGNCVMFIRTPSILECIEKGLESGDSSKNNAWDAIDKAELGYCEAFDFKCAASRTCDAWVVGGPITEDRKTEVKSLDKEYLPKHNEYYFLSSKAINDKNAIIDAKAAKQRLKNPKGGLTAAGRKYFKRTQGANLKPGVKGPADTPEKMRRKGSFLTRFFTNPSGPMKDEKGQPTRLALSAAAWGEPIPQNMESAAKLAEKGRSLLARYENTKTKDSLSVDMESKSAKKEKPFWEKPFPSKGKSSKLTDAQKKKAKARAKAAGRPYPNLIDNVWASKQKP